MRNISSLQHPLIKHLVSLREDRHYRYEKQRVLITGLKLIRELSPLFQFRTLVIEENFVPDFSYRAEETVQVPPQVLKKIAGLQKPEALAAELDMPQSQEVSAANFLLVLDGISDPGNLGTLLRTALALGWQGVFFTPGSCDPFNEKAIRAAKGATFKLPLQTGSLVELQKILKRKNFILLAADVTGINLKKCQISSPMALILGNEAHGISPELKQNAKMMSIPMSGPMESLNVATAGAILMFELRGVL